jgi:transcriptional regulator with XRE-family HTH domain
MLIEARKKANLTQTELSTILNRPQSYVSKYERGERRIDIIEFIEISNILGIDVSTFISSLQEKFKEEN